MMDAKPYRDLACAVVQQGVEYLKAAHHPREIAFFSEAAKSEVWCVAAGLDWEAATSRLRHDGHFVPAPPKPKKSAYHEPAPICAAYRAEIERRLLRKLPLYPETACSPRQLSVAVGVYVHVIRQALTALHGRGMAATRMEVRRGGPTAVWYRVEKGATIFAENIDTVTSDT